jgi:hypothetical protein
MHRDSILLNPFEGQDTAEVVCNLAATVSANAVRHYYWIQYE